jgi:outer membrane protein OmpA-like peptidoglycan-associated protein
MGRVRTGAVCAAFELTMRVTDAAPPGGSANPGAAERGGSAGTTVRPDALEQLRGLLVGKERARIDALQRQISDPDRRVSELAEALPDAVALRSEDDRFIDALQRPVDQCIKHSVERDPQGVADALFPVMGPAIGRAIGEALKGVVESINQAVEHSLSVKGLRWRVEAWRSGTSFAEVVLKNTLVYRVDAAYLIHNETGLLIEHALAATQTTLKDEDAMSAMLTAIQDFIQDSFTGAGEGLESVEIGGRSLWVLRGPQATLACVISGVPPRALRERLDATLRDLHLSFRRQLESFDGDKSALTGVEPLLQDCLTLEYREGAEQTGRRASWLPWAIIGVLLAVGIGWWGWTSYVWSQRMDAARAVLDETPGIVVVSWEPWNGGQVTLLVDPLAQPPAALIADEELIGRLSLQTQPYVSADAEIVLSRARQQLRIPPEVSLALNRGTLALGGKAPADWIGELRAMRALPPGVDALDLADLTPLGTGLVDRIRVETAAPASVEMAVSDGRLVLSGEAPLEWVAELVDRLPQWEDLSGCDDAQLRIAEVEEAKAIAAALNEAVFQFGESYKLAPGEDATLDAAAQRIGTLVKLSEVVPLGVEIEVIGHSDQTGTDRWKTWLRERRAHQVIRQLEERGVPEAVLHPVPRPGFEPPTEPADVAEQARLKVDLTTAPSSRCASQ